MCNSNIFSTILVFLRLRKKDGGKSDLVPNIQFDRVMFRSLSDCEDDSWYTRVYWAINRYFKYSPWGSPRRVYNETKFILQRARRGWADSDTRSLDGYLDSWMPDALRHLKEHKHGVPHSMLLPEDLIVEGDWQGNPSDEGVVRAEARWDAVMDKMIEAFEASKRISNGIYEAELGDYPMRSPSGVSIEAWEAVKKSRFAAIRLLTERDQKIFEEGMRSSSKIIARCGIEEGTRPMRRDFAHSRWEGDSAPPTVVDCRQGVGSH